MLLRVYIVKAWGAMGVYGQVSYVMFCYVSVLTLGIVAASFAHPCHTAAEMFPEKNEINIQPSFTACNSIAVLRLGVHHML